MGSLLIIVGALALLGAVAEKHTWGAVAAVVALGCGAALYGWAP